MSARTQMLIRKMIDANQPLSKSQMDSLDKSYRIYGFIDRQIKRVDEAMKRRTFDSGSDLKKFAESVLALVDSLPQKISEFQKELSKLK